MVQRAVGRGLSDRRHGHRRNGSLLLHVAKSERESWDPGYQSERNPEWLDFHRHTWVSVDQGVHMAMSGDGLGLHHSLYIQRHGDHRCQLIPCARFDLRLLRLGLSSR